MVDMSSMKAFGPVLRLPGRSRAFRRSAFAFEIASRSAAEDLFAVESFAVDVGIGSVEASEVLDEVREVGENKERDIAD